MMRLPGLLFFLFLGGCALFAQQSSGSPSPTPTPVTLKREETVIVTGTFEPIPLEASDRSVSSIEVQKSPLLFSSTVDFLRLDPSIDLQERAPGGIQADLSIRGASLGQTLVLINGLRVNDAQTPHHNLDLPLPLDSMDRIEVLHGAGSTFYGSDAVGGAVNFISAPAEVSRFSLRAGAGNFGYNEQRIAGAYASGNWSQELTAQRNFSTGFMTGRDYRNAQIASATHFKSHLGSTSLLLSAGDRPFGANQFYVKGFDSWERTKSWFTSLSQDLGPKMLFAFGYRRHTDEFILLKSDPALYENNHVTDSWQAALRRHEDLAQNVSLSYGAEGFRDQIDSNNLGHHARNRGAVYTSLDLRALRRFSFSIGAREESYNGTKGQFTPSIGGGFWLSSALKLRGSASRAFRLPSYTELFYTDPGNVGDPNLRPESGWSYEGGADWNAGHHVAASVTVFHRRMRDVIDYVFHDASDPDPLKRNKNVASNIDTLHFTGLETTVLLRQSSRSEFEIGYAAVHGEQQGLSSTSQSLYAFNYPANNAFLGWKGSIRSQVILRTRVGVTQRNQPSNNDPYALWDLAIARERGRVRPFLQFTNLGNTSYHVIPNVALPGRSVIAGVELTSLWKR